MPMTTLPGLALFSPPDFAALALLVVVWAGIGWRIEHPNSAHPSVNVLMEGFRHEWMIQMITRNPRVFDAQLLGSLRQGTSFFASALMIAIGGGLALIGNTEQLAGLARDLTLGANPAVVWEIKILVILLFLANAFLKFVWAHRLFGYCSVLMAAVPNDIDAPLVRARAEQAVELNITAARSFNRAMRATYFGLACSAWLLGPVALGLATVITAAVLWRREFASKSRAALLRAPPNLPAATQS